LIFFPLKTFKRCQTHPKCVENCDSVIGNSSGGGTDIEVVL